MWYRPGWTETLQLCAASSVLQSIARMVSDWGLRVAQALDELPQPMVRYQLLVLHHPAGERRSVMCQQPHCDVTSLIGMAVCRDHLQKLGAVLCGIGSIVGRASKELTGSHITAMEIGQHTSLDTACDEASLVPP